MIETRVMEKFNFDHFLVSLEKQLCIFFGFLLRVRRRLMIHSGEFPIYWKLILLDQYYVLNLGNSMCDFAGGKLKF